MAELENTALWPNLRVSHPETYKVRRLSLLCLEFPAPSVLRALCSASAPLTKEGAQMLTERQKAGSDALSRSVSALYATRMITDPDEREAMLSTAK